VYLIFKGQILNNDSLTLEEVFFGLHSPVVFVVNKKKINKVEQGFQSEIPKVENCPINKEEDQAGRCRICYSNETEPPDRLFRPCLCRGSVGLVHVSCLNTWRERPNNPEAYFRCSSCGYQYQISRTLVAALFSSDDFAKLFVVSIITILVLILSFFSLYVLPLEFNAWLFDTIEWSPPDNFLKHVIVGVLCIGLTGFIIHLSELMSVVRDHGSAEKLIGLGIALSANGQRGLRVFCACGLVVVIGLLYNRSQPISRRVLTRFGERILAVE
jgi:hypothetical protein